MKQRTTLSLIALGVLALFVMTASNRSDDSRFLRGLVSNDTNSTSANNDEVNNSTLANDATSVTKNNSNVISNKTNSSSEAYIRIDVAEARKHPQIYDAFLLGNHEAIAHLESEGKIPVTKYNVTEWVSASYKNSTEGIYYNFEVKLESANYIHLLLEPLVYYSHEHKTYRLASFSYHASNLTLADFNNSNHSAVNSTNNTQAANSTSAGNVTVINVNTTGVINIDNSTTIDNNVTDIANVVNVTVTVTYDNNTATNVNVTNSTTGTANKSNATYTRIGVAQAKNDSQIYKAFVLGNDDTIALLKSEGKIPKEQFNLTQWVSASYLNSTDGIYYNFETEFEGPNYIHLLLEPLVYYSYEHKTYRLASFSYRASNLTKADFGNSTNSTLNSTNSTQVVNTSATIIDNNATSANNSTL